MNYIDLELLVWAQRLFIFNIDLKTNDKAMLVRDLIELLKDSNCEWHTEVRIVTDAENFETKPVVDIEVCNLFPDDVIIPKNPLSKGILIDEEDLEEESLGDVIILKV